MNAQPLAHEQIMVDGADAVDALRNSVPIAAAILKSDAWISLEQVSLESQPDDYGNLTMWVAVLTFAIPGASDTRSLTEQRLASILAAHITGSNVVPSFEGLTASLAKGEFVIPLGDAYAEAFAASVTERRRARRPSLTTALARALRRLPRREQGRPRTQ